MIRLNEEWKLAEGNEWAIKTIAKKAWGSSGVKAAKWQGYICIKEPSKNHFTSYFYTNYPKARNFPVRAIFHVSELQD